MNLMQGDCLERMKEIPDGSVDMVLTDPPYGTTACKWDSVIPLEPMWEQLKRIIKPKGAIVLFGSQPFTSALVMSNPKWFKYCWIWDKKLGVGHLVVKKRPIQRTEDIVVFGDGGINYYPQMQKRNKPRSFVKQRGKTVHMNHVQEKRYEGVWTHRYPVNILEVSWTNRKDSVHPTQKPAELMAYLVQTYTNKGETVLDFTMGSGTTGVACVQTGRNFIGCEIDQNYFAIAQRRIAEAQAQPSLFEAAD